MRNAHLPTVCISVAATRCQYRKKGTIGHQVNKFEQVSTDDNQMFVPGGRVEGGGGSHVWCPREGSLRSYVRGVPYLVLGGGGGAGLG